MSPAPTFTAAQIAVALACNRRSVQRALDSFEEDGRQFVRGNEASAWKFSSLPESMRGKLDRRAKLSGFRNGEHLLSSPSPRFESSMPVNQLSGPVQERAHKLRQALARPLIGEADGLRGAALDEIGRREYQRVFGFEISSRHWRGLLNRTIARDAGEGQWDRLDLYLDERLHASRSLKKAVSFKDGRETEKVLFGYAAQVGQPSQPTSDEKALLWSIAFEQIDGLVAAGMKLSRARKIARRALWKCGVTLAANETSLAQLWRGKERTWRDAEGNLSVLKDKRSKASGNHRAPEISRHDLDQVIGHAVKYGGRVSEGWRHVIENRLLSPEVQSYFEGIYHYSKSYVPRIVREAVTDEVRRMRDIHHGPRTAALNGAFIERDWNGVAAGDWYQADDVTLNNYYYAPDEKGGLTLMRGQVLLMIDLRSTCIIGFAILDQRNYTAHSIRTLITRVCDEHGLPRQGFYFEGGIWENSRLLKGDAKASSADLTSMESEGGLRELGLRFKHSRKPRSKPVERVIGQLQNLLDGEPGDAGRDEVRDKFERLQKHKRLVESGHAPADQYFYSYEQWTNRIEHFCAEYNHARNDGKMTRGLTPFQAWEQFQAEPLVKLPDKARYLLAHHKREVVVGRNGIRLQFGKIPFIYRNAKTGKRVGQRVLAWFNPELPELLAVTDMNRENCFTVERAEEVPAMDAPDDVLQREMGRVAAHNAHARHRYRVLAKIANLNPRPTVMDRATADLGQAIESQKAEMKVTRNKRMDTAAAGARAFSKLGFTNRRGVEHTPTEVKAAQRLSEILNEEESS
jgi:hypothetical protein